MESQVRIIYAGFYPKPGRRVLCRAYHEGLRPPQYVWIGPGWFPGPYWWRNREDGDLIVGNITCNNTVMDFMAEGYFSTDPPLTWDGNKTTVSNMTSEEWIKAYNTYRKYDLYAKYAGGYNFAGYVYDATWAVALTLNNSIQRLAKKKLTLEGFTYGNVDYLEVFTSEMAKLQFLGVTGPLSFTKTGDRVGITVIRRVQNHSHIVIAKYIDQSAKVIWDDSINYIWGTPASGFGIVLAIILLRFNVSYREDRAIKITSPNINIAIICGAILCYISVPFLGLDSNILGISTYGMYAHSLVCRIRIWLLLLGFMMGFSALFTKTWRLYVIFTNKTSRKQGMKDKQLSRFIIIAVLVGIIILTAQAIVDPINLQNMILNTKTEENGDLKIVYSITTCVTKHPAIWQSLMLGSNGILLLYGLALAWKTRNIACDVANDSKTIGLAVYNVCVFSSTAALIGFTVTQPAVRFSMIALFILLSTTGSMCLIFLPKVWMIKDLARVNSTQRSNEADSEPGKLIERHLHHSASRSSIMPDPKVYKLQDEISELKSLLAKKCQRIEELEESLLKSKISTITNNEDTIPRLHPELAEDASNSCRCKSANCWKSYFNQDSQEISSYNNSYLSVQSPQQRRVSFLSKD
ncbi:Gamma-aminobutyric acid type B receptor subunit 2 [Trichoplax sp. H2]|nr:Gamma-aminobutyric acid type B receptor subunit 2 [Trichoplax sp. H2]|eukprot:RDD36281.1 Gamma-aminobutyric acid type B receptor subunit 2 [Trichoplax sp. H2]